MKIVTADQMKVLDKKTIESGVPGIILMERAGSGAVKEILLFCSKLHPCHVQHVVILAGKGNNGGDGYVIARLLTQQTNYRISVYSICPLSNLKGDAYQNAIQLPAEVEFKVGNKLPDILFNEGVIFIDCLLGTGISGDLKEPSLSFVDQVNKADLPVISIDIPSGINSNTGKVGNAGIHADLTVTIGLPKMGLFLDRGQELCGILRLIDIGILPELIETIDSPVQSLFKKDIRALIHRLPKSLHKGKSGRILIIGSSRQFPGASFLTGSGAIRSGGGLVTVAYPQSISSTIHPKENALILRALEDNGEGHHIAQPQKITESLFEDKNVIAIGPGLTRTVKTQNFVAQVLETEKTIVLDADALDVFIMEKSIFPRKGTTVLTPHPGELKRILKARNLHHLAGNDRISQAKSLATDLQAFVVLKGSATVIASPDGEIFINSSGTPALATGGTGDVLTGMIAGFICQFPNVLSALKCAVFIHGLAAELYSYGMRNLVADDLSDLIGQALKEVSPFA